MGKPISKFFHLFVLLAVVAAVKGSMVEVVEGNVCTDAMGACGAAGDCDRRCKEKHEGGQGTCDMNLCSCHYNCGSSGPGGPGEPERKCNGGLGLCTSQCDTPCCNANCASRFNQGIGFCDDSTGTSLCNCQYVC